MSATIFGALRRKLLKQGMTLRPVCPGCRLERHPSDFRAGGLCWACTIDADALETVRFPSGGGTMPVGDLIAPDDGRDYE